MKRIFATVLLVIGIVGLLDAQTVISNESMTHDGTDVTVSFDVDTDVKGLPSNRKEVIMPYIYIMVQIRYFLTSWKSMEKDAIREKGRSIISMGTRIGNLVRTRL